MGSRAAWALGEWQALEMFVRGEHMQARRHVVEEGQGVETCLVLEAVVATQKGRLEEVTKCALLGQCNSAIIRCDVSRHTEGSSKSSTFVVHEYVSFSL